MTSIEWLITWMTKHQYFIGNDLLNAFEEAEKMHKQEIMDAWKDGEMYNDEPSDFYAEKYYNEHFKKD